MSRGESSYIISRAQRLIVSPGRYLGIYVGLVVFTIFVFIARAIWFLIGRMGLARTVHRVLYASIISAPLRCGSPSRFMLPVVDQEYLTQVA